MTLPNSTLGKALYVEYIQDDPSHSSMTRNQYVMWGDSNASDRVQRLDQAYIKMDVRWDNEGNLDWLLPVEWKTEGETYRVGFYIYDTDTANPYWVLEKRVGTAPGTLDDYTRRLQWIGCWRLQSQLSRSNKRVVHARSDPNQTNGVWTVAVDGTKILDLRGRTAIDDHLFYFSPFKVYGCVGYEYVTSFEYPDAEDSGIRVVRKPFDVDHLLQLVHSE